MAKSLLEGKLWIQTSRRPRKNWSCVTFGSWRKCWVNALIFLATYIDFHHFWQSFVFCFFELRRCSPLKSRLCAASFSWGRRWINTYLKVSLWMFSLCNDCRLRKWTRWPGFKAWTRLFAFPTAEITLGKIWIQIFSPLYE